MLANVDVVQPTSLAFRAAEEPGHANVVLNVKLFNCLSHETSYICVKQKYVNFSSEFSFGLP